MFFGKNIKLLRKRRGRTQDDVSHAISIKRPTLSGYENDVAEPGMKILVAFSEYFKISIDTLVKVDLSSLSESLLSEIERGFDVYVSGSKVRILATTVDAKNKENIELVPEKAKAGYTNGFADPEYIRELPVFQLPFLEKEKKYRSFQISGDSMLPIPEGAYVTGEFVLDWHRLKTNTPCILLTYNDGLVFKIVENLLEEKRSFRLHSLNPIYKPYEMNVGEIREIWRFVNYISPEIPSPQIPQNDIIGQISKLQSQLSLIQDKFNLES